MSEHPDTQLTAYLDQELDARQQAAFETHLQSCLACRTELDEQLALRHLLETLPPVPQPIATAQFWQALEPQLQPRRTRLGLAWLWGIALVAAVLIVQTFFIALRLANILEAAGWLPGIQTPIALSERWGTANRVGILESVFWNNSLVAFVLDTPVTPFLPYLLTLILSSILALIFLGWAYAYLCSQSTTGCQPVRK